MLPRKKLDEARPTTPMPATPKRSGFAITSSLWSPDLQPRRALGRVRPGSTKRENVQPHRSCTDFFFFLRSLRAA